MLDNLMTVLTQAVSLFIMMGFGFGLFRLKMVTPEGISGMTNVLLWAVTPCLLINTFSRGFDRELAVSLGIFALGALLVHVLAAVIARIIFRKREESEAAIMRFASIFSNCGFMGLPLAEALYGEEGVMYASIFVAVFNIILWTYGFAMLSGKGASVKKLLINPGVIGVLLGLPLFFFSIELPEMLSGTISTLASMNTPLAMIVIGCHLAKANLLGALTDRRVYAVCAVRLLLMPLPIILLAALLPIPLSKAALCVLCIEAAAPVAAIVVPMGDMCGKDTELAGRCVAAATLLSVITLPLTAAICGAVL